MAGPVICLPVDVLCSSGLEVLGSGPGTIPVAEVIDAIPQFMAVAVEGGLAIEIDETPSPLCPACAVGFMASQYERTPLPAATRQAIRLRPGLRRETYPTGSPDSSRSELHREGHAVPDPPAACRRR